MPSVKGSGAGDKADKHQVFGQVWYRAMAACGYKDGGWSAASADQRVKVLSAQGKNNTCVHGHVKKRVKVLACRPAWRQQRIPQYIRGPCTAKVAEGMMKAD